MAETQPEVHEYQEPTIQEQIQQTEEQLQHYKALIEKYTPADKKAEFENLEPSGYHQFTLDAIAAKREGGERFDYIGTVTLVHREYAKERLKELQAELAAQA